jgi:hypothetical protein
MDPTERHGASVELWRTGAAADRAGERGGGAKPSSERDWRLGAWRHCSASFLALTLRPLALGCAS